jgi:hypothetical protein
MALVAASLLISTQSTFARGKYPDVGSIKVDGDFHDYIIPWTDGAEYVGKIALIETKQGLALCGAGYLKGGIQKHINDQMLTSTYIKNNGKIIIENFRYFTHYKSKTNFKNASAKCKLTKLRRGLQDSDNLKFGQRTRTFYD